MKETPLAQIQEWARQAIDRMRTHGVPPTPRNYALWYSYVSGQDALLTEELNKALGGAVSFDQGITDYLYQKYIEPPADSRLAPPRNTHSLLANILKLIHQMSGETESYHQQIDSQLGELKSQTGSSELRAMAEIIIESTMGLKKSSQELHRSLSESQHEIETLRKHLQEATHEAQRDFLTGLFNRKAFDRMMDELVGLAQTQGLSLSLLMIDIDHFKHFNDQYGHLIGDEVLKIVARLLKDTLKGTDIVARFGGEEFAVILPQTPLKGAHIVAENIRRAVADRELKHRESGSRFGSVTVSIGLAVLQPGDTVPLLIKRADTALYAAKHAGRNCVSFAE